MENPLTATLAAAHAAPGARQVSAGRAAAWLTDLLGLLFPALAAEPLPDAAAVATALAQSAEGLAALLAPLPGVSTDGSSIAEAFFAELPTLRVTLLADADFQAANDPAATDAAEVIGTYPGFYATAVHRMAHALHRAGVPLLPRVLAEVAHARTGIDIHPGARIGVPFGIDHGTGLVVGATAIIGRYVQVFQGVTLGALHVAKELATQKRHPTIEDHVVVYAGATILGGGTVVGAHSIIGGNVWLTRSVPAYSRVYHRAQVEVRGAEGPVEGLMFEI